MAYAAHAHYWVGSFVKSAHFVERQNQRRVMDSDIELTIRCGRRFYEGREIVYFLGRKDIPATLSSEQARRVEGTIVVTSRDGELVFTYRNPGAMKHFKKRRN